MTIYKKTISSAVGVLIVLVIGFLYINRIQKNIIEKEYRDLKLICGELNKDNTNDDVLYIYFRVKLDDFEERGYMGKRIADSVKAKDSRARDAESMAREFVFDFQNNNSIPSEPSVIKKFPKTIEYSE